MKTNLKDLRYAGACYEGYNKVVRHLQGLSFSRDDEVRESYLLCDFEGEIELETILESNGLFDALWVIRACTFQEDILLACRMFGVHCATQIKGAMNEYSALALTMADRFARGEGTLDEMLEAHTAAVLHSKGAADDAGWAVSQLNGRAIPLDTVAAVGCALHSVKYRQQQFEDEAERLFKAVFCGDAIDLTPLQKEAV